jgi:hypothetical protein
MSINTTNQIPPSQLSILIVEDELAVANDFRQFSSYLTFWSSDC